MPPLVIWGSGEKVDNHQAYAQEKLALRIEAIRRLGEPRSIVVLDAYHGHGVMWGDVRRALPDWDIQLFRSDREQRKAGTLRVDNARLLASLDLARFDLIDLDAYGWPIDQITLCAHKAPNTMVVSTRIQGFSKMAMMPSALTRALDLHIPDGFARILLHPIREEAWDALLYQLGYRWSRRYYHDLGTAIKCYELLLPAGWDPEPPPEDVAESATVPV